MQDKIEPEHLNKIYNIGDLITLKYPIENIILYKSINIDITKLGKIYFLSNQIYTDIKNHFLIINSYHAIEWHQYKYNKSIKKNILYKILVNGIIYYTEEKNISYYENLFQ